ncbi:unnamed protein product [Notodromas monacha]|uniref:CCHC-type domain-containing protein n=1 Tax=Notodromas monacha TaxID=399045 RepID=A0A7R9BRM9_9CRUS|nr:unnamed protein product [Notodromas monacha]CAG0918913.1 unnamed protein product [Notodromas monacha]
MGDRMMMELSALDLKSYTAQELSDAMARALCHVQHLSGFELIKPFEGGTTKFIHFLFSFEELIVKGLKCGALKFMVLKKYLRGEALYLVKNIGVHKDAYKDALEILKIEYASPSRIIRDVMKKLEDFPAIKVFDEKKLDDLKFLVLGIAMTLNHYDMTADLNSFLLMALIKDKLPAELHVAWDPLIRKMLIPKKERYIFLSLIYQDIKKKLARTPEIRMYDRVELRNFSNVIDSIARILNENNMGSDYFLLEFLCVLKYLPVDLRLKWVQSIREKETPVKQTQLESFAAFLHQIIQDWQAVDVVIDENRKFDGCSADETESEPEVIAAEEKRCLNCKRNNHVLEDCFYFLEKSAKRRTQKAINLNLCFKCLKQGHTSRRCKAKLESCESCHEKHHALLHCSRVRPYLLADS